MSVSSGIFGNWVIDTVWDQIDSNTRDYSCSMKNTAKAALKATLLGLVTSRSPAEACDPSKIFLAIPAFLLMAFVEDFPRIEFEAKDLTSAFQNTQYMKHIVRLGIISADKLASEDPEPIIKDAIKTLNFASCFFPN